MAWQTELVELLRVMVNDLADTPTYSDYRLQRVLVVAAFQVSTELDFSRDFVVDVTAQTITPDPTDGDDRNDAFTNLVCMKAACITDRGEAAAAAKQAIAVRDGTSAIDLRGNLQGKLKLLEKGWCAAYDDAKLEYQAGQVHTAGAAIIGPFRFWLNSTYQNGLSFR